MRASRWLLGLATTAAVASAAAAGCGGSSTSGTADSGTPVDATTDVGVEAAVEASSEGAPADALPDVCTSDAMITSISAPDGSIPGTDASAQVCLECVQSACPNLVMQCNAICGCPAA